MVHSAEDEPLISRNFTPHEPVTLFFFLKKKEKVTKPHDVRGYTDSLCSKCPKYPPKYPEYLECPEYLEYPEYPEWLSILSILSILQGVTLFLTIMGVPGKLIVKSLIKKISFRDYNTVEAQNDKTKLLAALHASCMPLKD